MKKASDLDFGPFDHSRLPDWLKKLEDYELFELKVMWEAACSVLLRLPQGEGKFGYPYSARDRVDKGDADVRDVTTTADQLVDRAVVATLKELCPTEIIVSEESSPGDMKQLLKQRSGWIVDPICGSANLAAGLQLLATNIIYVVGGGVSKVAVVDHLNRRIILGSKSGDSLVEFWEGDEFVLPVPKLSISPPQPRMIEFNMGYARQLDAPTRERIRKCCGDFLAKKNFLVRMLGSSLPFAQVATGQFQGAVTFNVKPWDLLAGAALTQWAGGVATDLAGHPVTLETRSAILASHAEVHAELAGLIRRRGLQSLK